MPYVLHAFLQISSLCSEVYIGVSQAGTKLPFPRTCYTKCTSKPEGYHFNPPNHSTDIILQSAVFLHTKAKRESRKNVQKKERQKLLNYIQAGVALQALGFYIISN